jgi:hemerythrin-like domain-containing protein
MFLRQHGRRICAMQQRHLDEEDEILLMLAAREVDEVVVERIRHP